MIVTDGTQRCQVCGKNMSIVLCDGCSIHICADCRRWDLWGYGCGHVDSKSFCAKCHANPAINPWGADHGEL